MKKRLAQIQKRTYEILEVAKKNDLASRIADTFLISIILLNILTLMLETLPSLSPEMMRYFKIFDTFSVWVFLIEYCLRVWSIGVSEEYGYGMKERFRFMKSPSAVIDLVAFLPYFIGLDFRFLRLFRLLRLGKLNRYSESMQVLFVAIEREKDKLVSCVILLMIMFVVCSCMMFELENAAQPEVFSSIPQTMWWSIVTLTTVGYGDMAPITPLGRAFAGLTAFVGIGLFALPTSILGASFVVQAQERKTKKRIVSNDNINNTEEER